MPAFKPLSLNQEMRLVAKDDVSASATKRYLRSLIEQAVRRHAAANDRQRLRTELLQDVDVAVRRFRRAFPKYDAPYRFSTYFTWYIAERVNVAQDRKSRPAVRRRSTS